LKDYPAKLIPGQQGYKFWVLCAPFRPLILANGKMAMDKESYVGFVGKTFGENGHGRCLFHLGPKQDSQLLTLYAKVNRSTLPNTPWV